MSVERGSVRILDIGTGPGGRYISHDSKDNSRIAMDMRAYTLRLASETYAIQALQANADLSRKAQYLPFADDSFHKIDVYFPHNSLLVNLADSESRLWSEFDRVLDETGHVQVTFDVPEDNAREVKVEENIIRIEQPENKIWKAGTDAGFVVSVRRLTEDELKEIGTPYANRAIEKKHASYRVIAHKIK